MKSIAVLSAGCDFSQWIRRGGVPDRARRSLIWLYMWRAFWFERSFRMLHYPRRAEQIPSDDSGGNGLVFIMGFWRSGTTLLHEMLACCPGCGAPVTWQCMDPSAMLAKHGRRNSRSVERPMDRVRISSYSPQEDEFALMAMGVPSLYRGFVDPRRLPELEALMEQNYWMPPNVRWAIELKQFLSWCRNPEDALFIVKSPNHLFRYNALEQYFSGARFIWIFRNPVDLWRSNIKMWQAMIARYALWQSPEGIIERFLFTALRTYSDLLKNVKPKPHDKSHAIFSYEDLLSNSECVMRKIASFLCVAPWPEWEVKIRQKILSMPNPSILKRSSESERRLPLELLAEVAARQQQWLNIPSLSQHDKYKAPSQ